MVLTFYSLWLCEINLTPVLRYKGTVRLFSYVNTNNVFPSVHTVYNLKLNCEYELRYPPHLCGFPKPFPELSGGKESRNFGPVLHAGKPLAFSQLLGGGEVNPLSPLWSPHLPFASIWLRFRRSTSLSRSLSCGWFSGFRFSRNGSRWRG